MSKIKLVSCCDPEEVLEGDSWEEIGEQYILCDGWGNLTFKKDRDVYGRFSGGVNASRYKGSRREKLGWYISQRAALSYWAACALNTDFERV